MDGLGERKVRLVVQGHSEATQSARRIIHIFSDAGSVIFVLLIRCCMCASKESSFLATALRFVLHGPSFLSASVH